jgi:hypothetical protein
MQLFDPFLRIVQASIPALLLLSSGCALYRPERIVALREVEENRPAGNKTLVFVREWEPKVLPVDQPLFGETIVNVPLDANGQAHIHLRRVHWRAVVENSSAGATVDIRNGGLFPLYESSSTSSNTNLEHLLRKPKYMLTIKKPGEP